MVKSSWFCNTLFALLLFSTIAPTPAHGDFIRYNFEGSFNIYMGYRHEDGAQLIGETPFNGFFEYDLNGDRWTQDVNASVHISTVPPFEINSTNATKSYLDDIVIDAPYPKYSDYLKELVLSRPEGIFELVMYTESNSIITLDKELPDNLAFSASFTSNSRHPFYSAGLIGSIKITKVPEISSAIMLCAGMQMLIAIRQRFKN